MVEDQERILIAAAAVLIADSSSDEENPEENNRRERRWWTRPWIERRDTGQGLGLLALLENELRLEDTESFQNIVRMDVGLFEQLLQVVRPHIEKQDTVMRAAIPARKRLAATLHYLATGCTFKALAFYTRIAACTLQGIVCETLQAIKVALGEVCIKTPSTIGEWLAVAERFESLWNYPHCIGAIDGKHIVFRAPIREKAYYRNYKQSESVVLMAVVDADYKFLFINVGVNGRMNDAGVFRESGLPVRLADGSLNLPPPSPLPGRIVPVPYVIVADDAFPLSKHVMKPYGNRGNDMETRIHDYRLSRARRVVENAFGILSNKFGILLKSINLSPEKVELITVACCILHNFILTQRPVAIRNNPNESTVAGNDGGNWPGLQNHQGGNRHANIPQNIRHEFRAYFNSVGAVPWQERAVEEYRW